MIGFFDSWFWWLQTMKYFHDLYPDYDYIFLADNKNCPFWGKSGEEIQKITFNALNWLFDNWANIVVIACNTAAAHAIRKWQSLYPHKKTLSITIPGIEELIYNEEKYTSVWIIATQATVLSNIYKDLYKRFWGSSESDFHFVIAPDLVTMVESWIEDETKIKLAINGYLSQFPKNISTLVLGCTHFSVYKKYFTQLFDGVVIDPSFYSAHKFWKYLKNHSEVQSKLSTNGVIRFQTTWDIENFNEVGTKILWKEVQAVHALI